MYRDAVYKTYVSHFPKLSPTKRFHFASRLAGMSSDPWALRELASLREWFLGGTTPAEYGKRLQMLGKNKPNPIHLNAASERMRIFDAYPWLYGYETQLFQVLHANNHYNTDLRHLLGSPVSDIESQINKLSSDPKMLAILSTYLIDIYYLYHRIIRSDDSPVIDESLFAEALEYQFSPEHKARLNVYLLTHCIIGETLFYSRDIPEDKHGYYLRLSKLLEKIANREWEHLTLDNKLEIALCFQLVGYESTLVSNAITESDENFDAPLGFITDSKMPHKNDLEWAEHRNVLYLLVTMSDTK